MDASLALAIIETVLAPKSLSSVQIQIICGVITGCSYQQIAVAEIDRIEGLVATGIWTISSQLY